jgi:antitoxin (DNA-binding transcriptional repressor) of toxin-antitoxin stability system
MQVIQVADLKARFSDILKQIVDEGEEYVIQYGRKHKWVAVLIPYDAYEKRKTGIKLGLLSQHSYKIHDDFEITTEEFLGL